MRLSNWMFNSPIPNMSMPIMKSASLPVFLYVFISPFLSFDFYIIW